MSDALSARGSLRASLLNLGHAAWGQGFGAVCALAAIRIYTELLQRDQFGAAMLMLGAVALADGLVTMAFSQTLLSLFGRDLARERRPAVAAALVLRALRVLWIAAGGLLVFAAVASAWLHRLWPLTAVLVLASYLSLELTKASAQAALLTDRRYRDYSWWVAGEALLGLIFCTLSLLFVDRGVIAFAVGFFAGRAVSTVLFLLVHQHFRHFTAPAWAEAQALIPAAVSYGWPVSAMAPLGWVSAYIDRYVLAASGGTGVVGVYTAVTGLVSRPYAISTSVLTNYFRPQLYAGGAAAQRSHVERRWVLSALAIGGLGCIAFCVFGDLIARLVLAEEYRTSATEIMIAIAISQTFVIMTHGVDNGVLASRRSGALLRTQIAMLVLPFVFIPLLAIKYGALGAAGARCIVEGTKFGFTWWLSRRILAREGGS